MKLDLGAGPVSPPGFTPMGYDHGTEIFPLPVPDDSADAIRCSHALEHLPHEKVGAVLADWVRALKPGGTLRIAVPDFARIAQNYVDGVEQNTQGYVMGGHIDAHDHHRSIFDERSLRKLMSDAGLVLLRPWISELEDDAAALPISLNLEGRKPHVSRLVVRGVMSAPRLGYNDMWNAAVQVLPALGVPFRKVGGAFWGQTLTLGLEQLLAEEPDVEYVLTLDYDSVFNARAAADLIQLAMVHPEADAIAPLQASRHGANPLFSFKLPEGAVREGDRLDVPAAMFAADLVPMRTAHFGLTLIRADKLRALPRPWFAATPDADGGWGEGHTDEDIHFWRQWERAGNSLNLAPGVRVGHLELMVRWPDTEMRPTWQTAAEWEASRQPPANVWGN